MRTEYQEGTTEDRLTDEELIALRARLHGSPAARTHAATVASIAELLGRSPQEVMAHLEQIRAESAVSSRKVATAAESNRQQRQLLALAVVLLTAAAVIYRVTPRKLTEAEIDARLQEVIANRAKRPKAVHYPITNTVDVGKENESSFDVEFNGRLTKTFAKRGPQTSLLTASEAERRLLESIRRTYPEAAKYEASAPEPTTPLKPLVPFEIFGLTPRPGFLAFRCAVCTDYLPTDGVLTPEIEARLRENIRGGIKQAFENQERMLREQGPREAWMSPPGFSISFGSGAAQRSVSNGTSITLWPVNKDLLGRRLETCIRTWIRATLEGTSPGNPFPAAKVRPPAPIRTLDIQINGPGKPVKFTVPVAAGPGYPTAADALVAREKLLVENVRKSVDSMDALVVGEH